MAALHKLSVHCNFGTYLKSALRNQFVFGLRSQRAQSRLLETRDLTFEKAVQVATAMELSEKDTKQFQAGTAVVEYLGAKANKPKKKFQQKKKSIANPEKGKTESNKHSVDKVQNNTSVSNTNSKISCFRCGGNHLANKCTLDRNIKCNNCGTPGHLQKVCMGSKRVNANQVEEVFVAEQIEHRNKFYKVLSVEGQSLRFEMDSGAAVSIVSVRTVRKMFPLKRLQPTTLQLVTFCKTSIKVIGILPVLVFWRGRQVKLNLYVTNVEREPLIGREWIRRLHLSLFDTVKTVNTLRENTNVQITKLLQRYREKLDPLSTKIRGIQAKLTTKENIKQVFLKARTVPFKLLPLVEQELQALVQDGILEKVNTSRWATPIVPVLKKNNRIRICGDFSVSINPNLLLDEHPLPTVDELFATWTIWQEE